MEIMMKKFTFVFSRDTRRSNRWQRSMDNRRWRRIHFVSIHKQRFLKEIARIKVHGSILKGAREGGGEGRMLIGCECPLTSCQAAGFRAWGAHRGRVMEHGRLMLDILDFHRVGRSKR